EGTTPAAVAAMLGRGGKEGASAGGEGVGAQPRQRRGVAGGVADPAGAGRGRGPPTRRAGGAGRAVSQRSRWPPSAVPAVPLPLSLSPFRCPCSLVWWAACPC